MPSSPMGSILFFCLPLKKANGKELTLISYFTQVNLTRIKTKIIKISIIYTKLKIYVKNNWLNFNTWGFSK